MQHGAHGSETKGSGFELQVHVGQCLLPNQKAASLVCSTVHTVCQVEEAPLNPDAVITAIKTRTICQSAIRTIAQMLEQEAQAFWALCRMHASVVQTQLQYAVRQTECVSTHGIHTNTLCASLSDHTRPFLEPLPHTCNCWYVCDSPRRLKDCLLQATAVEVNCSVCFGQAEEFGSAVHQHLLGAVQ